MMTNPWKNMQKNTQRRVDDELKHNIFWLVDANGKYGFYIDVQTFENDKIDSISLKGISILKKEANDRAKLFIGLNNNEDWNIFYTLCKDLIGIAKKYENEKLMFNAIEVRLKKWQQFLLKNKTIDFPLYKQMGLFSELMTLRDIIAENSGFDVAVKSWVGANFDKQDFLLDNCIFEIKSYKTSKTPIVNISSANQLYSDKVPLILITYGLTPSQNKGIELKELIEIIEQESLQISMELYELFWLKLYEYGYMSGIETNSFLVDKKMYFNVEEGFPKIIPPMIKSQILDVKYSIDLLQCQKFLISLEKVEEYL
ncbi:PD-(D/E)XK motif protein [Sulfurimonas sp.]